MIPMAFSCKWAFVVPGHDLLRPLGRTCVEGSALVQLNIGLGPALQEKSQELEWNLTFVNVKYIP